MNRFLLNTFITVMFLSLTSCGYSLIKNYEQDVLKTWTDVETNLHKRADLVPELIEFVNNYAPDESDILKNVIKTRAKTAMIQFTANDLSNPLAMNAFAQVQNDLTFFLTKLKNTVDRYPALKADQNFFKVMKKIEDTESRMAISCSQYNNAVEIFNQSIGKFPNNVTNKLFLQIRFKEKLKLQRG